MVRQKSPYKCNYHIFYDCMEFEQTFPRKSGHNDHVGGLAIWNSSDGNVAIACKNGYWRQARELLSRCIRQSTNLKQ